ncbi:unnamed protein product [Knipowitschia caucasica]
MADRTQTLHPTIVSDGHGAAEQKQRNTLMHGGQFAHFTKKGKQIVNGCLSPIFRLKRKRQPTEETNQRPWTMNNQCKAKMTEIVQQTQLKAVKETQWVQQLECADDQVHEGEQLN